MAPRWSPSPPISARARSWSRRARRPRCWASSEIHIEDLREEFVRDFVFPMFRMNALYEGVYLLGTSIARPLIAKRLVEIAHETGADAIAHGATGKGNDQVRFELTAYALDPEHQGDRAVARVGVQVAHRPDRLRREAPDPGAQGQARRGAVLGRRQPSALLLGGQGAGGPVGGAAALRLPAHGRAGGRARQGDRRRDRIQERRSGRRRRRGDEPGDAAHPPQRARPRQRHRPRRSGREPLRRHEVARHLRDAGRHHPVTSPTAPSNR